MYTDPATVPPGWTIASEEDAAGSDHEYVPHVHDHHELLWGATGMFSVVAGDEAWMVPPMHGIWVPAGVVHAGFIGRGVRYVCTFVAPSSCPVEWIAPTPVAMTPALRELIRHVVRVDIEPDARHRAERVILDLIVPAANAGAVLPMPRDARARRVAAGLLADLGDGRSIDAWGAAVGAGGRTLARLFDDETGMSFGRWRTHARVQAALGRLADGEPVAAVARSVGYQTSSSFVRVFRQVTGQTPGAYLAAASAASMPRRWMAGVATADAAHTLAG